MQRSNKANNVGFKKNPFVSTSYSNITNRLRLTYPTVRLLTLLGSCQILLQQVHAQANTTTTSDASIVESHSQLTAWQTGLIIIAEIAVGLCCIAGMTRYFLYQQQKKLAEASAKQPHLTITIEKEEKQPTSTKEDVKSYAEAKVNNYMAGKTETSPATTPSQPYTTIQQPNPSTDTQEQDDKKTITFTA